MQEDFLSIIIHDANCKHREVFPLTLWNSSNWKLSIPNVEEELQLSGLTVAICCHCNCCWHHFVSGYGNNYLRKKCFAISYKATYLLTIWCWNSTSRQLLLSSIILTHMQKCSSSLSHTIIHDHKKYQKKIYKNLKLESTQMSMAMCGTST